MILSTKYKENKKKVMFCVRFTSRNADILKKILDGMNSTFQGCRAHANSVSITTGKFVSKNSNCANN